MSDAHVHTSETTETSIHITWHYIPENGSISKFMWHSATTHYLCANIPISILLSHLYSCQWPQQHCSPNFNIYCNLCLSSYGPQPQLSGSQNNFMSLLATNPHYFDKCIKSSVFVCVIICSDTVEILAWLSCHKYDTDHWLPGLPASQWKIIGFTKHNSHVAAEVTVLLAKFEALWGIPHQSWKISKLKVHEDYL
jgi:hypothetical protein